MVNSLVASDLGSPGLFQWLDALVHLQVFILILHTPGLLGHLYLHALQNNTALTSFHTNHLDSKNSGDLLCAKRVFGTPLLCLSTSCLKWKENDWLNYLFEWLSHDTFTFKIQLHLENTLVHMFTSDTTKTLWYSYLHFLIQMRKCFKWCWNEFHKFPAINRGISRTQTEQIPMLLCSPMHTWELCQDSCSSQMARTEELLA